MFRISIIVVILLFSFLLSAAMADCRDDIDASTPSADFLIHGDGTVTQRSTRLMWMRCSLGQTWDGINCNGSAISYSWQESLREAQQHDFGGYGDWRLPNKNELANIIEDQCYSPTINNEVFPSTPESSYWTSSPASYSHSSAWTVHFSKGYIQPGPVDRFPSKVRLVREIN